MQINKQDEKLLQELLKKYKQGIISGMYQGSNITFAPTGCRDKIISSTSSGIGGGIQSIQEGDNITVDNTDPLNPIVSASGGGTSALFPNGIELVSESRDFNSGDANKLLAIRSDDITLSMPSVNPFGKGDLVGIQNTNDYKNTHIILKEGNEPILIGDEVFIFDLVDIGGGIYVPQPLTGIIYDENGENAKSIIRYLYDQSQNAIPLSGTEIGKPVTGDIEFYNSGEDITKYLKFNNTTGGFIFGDENEFVSPNQLYLFDGTYFLSIGTVIDRIEIAANNPNSKGIGSASDFTANITDLDYTQKKYVDTKLSRQVFNINTSTTADNISNIDYVYNISGGSTLTLPTAVGNTNEYKINNVDTIPCDIVADGVETIDGLSLFTLIYQYDSITLISDGASWVAGGGGSSYTFSTGLTNTAGTVTANLSTGIAGGQSVIGGTASGNNLTLSSTSNPTKSKILFGNSTYNELTNMLGIGTTSPTQPIEVTRNTSGADYPSILIKNTNTSGDSFSAIDLQVNNGAVWSQLLASGTNTVFGAPGVGFRVITGHPFFIQTNNVTRLTVAAGGNVGIGTLTPVASAKLELSSTTQGFLPPRMTATQASAISSPAQGLMLFVTDTNGTFTGVGWWGYNGANWEKLNN